MARLTGAADYSAGMPVIIIVRWTVRCVIARPNHIRSAPRTGHATSHPHCGERGGPQGRAEGIGGKGPGVLGLTVRSV
jgi:hypothetical protein